MPNATAATRHTPPGDEGPPHATRMTREDLLRAGLGANPAHFLPIAATALGLAPQDAGLRFLFAANLAKLGLRTLAGEQLSQVAAEAGDDPHVTQLRAALSGLPDDVVRWSTVDATLSRNIDALRGRGIWLDRPLTAWREAAAGFRWFQRLDGGLVCCGPGATPCDWRGLHDVKGAAVAAISKLLPVQELFPLPFVIDGMAAPEPLTSLWKASAAGSCGYSPWISVVCPDEDEMLHGLAMQDMVRLIGDDRVEWFVGVHAIGRMKERWRGRLDAVLPRMVVTPLGTRRTYAPAIAAALEAVAAEQESAAATLRKKIDSIYAGRDAGWWAAKYARSEPLSVLVMSSRFSTFVRFSAQDLADAIGEIGHRAKVSMEPGPHSRGSSLGVLRTVESLTPDLVVLINHPRSSCGAGVPDNVPFVTWLQDAMPHMFDEGAGSRQTPLDFLAGHLFPELFTRFGYNPAQALGAPVAASAAKFHPGVVIEPLLERYECELALISHHSETPERMHERLLGEVASTPAIRSVFELLRGDIVDIVEASSQVPPAKAIQAATLARLREVLGTEPQARTISLVQRCYATPLADRMLRHQTAAWGAEICQRRGWRFHVYGRGWETHPTLACWACGPLDHGEDLRAAYRSAALSLHVSINALVHQRVLETFLSGGLCACRMHRDALAGPKSTAQEMLLLRTPEIEEHDRIGYVIADHPEAMQLACESARLGHAMAEGVIWISRKRAEAMRSRGPGFARDTDLDSVTGDMSELVFASSEDLEALVSRAIAHPQWRAARGAWARKLIDGRFTHEAFAKRMIRFIGEKLAAQAARRSAA